ncbi:MAG: host attachment protein [Candidatus Solibacter sp.]
MEIQTLQKHVLTLATIAETDAPMVSCYLNLEHGLAEARRILDERVRLLRKTLALAKRDAFEQALLHIESRLDAGFQPESRSAAIFSRAGDVDFFLDLEFRVPLPNWLAVNSTANIYHLVELKDNYHRYVLVVVNERSTRILEVHLGSVTEAAWAKRPELRERAGSGWGREHYRNHRPEPNHRFANEVVRCVDDVMAKGGYGHLILAGTPRMTALIPEALPKRLSSKLIDVVPASANERTSTIVAETLASFIEEEQQESLDAVDRLQMNICANGLAVAGSRASLLALQCRQVDMLVMATEYRPEPAWVCSSCDTLALQPSQPVNCAHCGSTDTRELDVKEELARLAELGGCGIEIVHDSDVLMRLGGVGCLLRFLAPDAYFRPAQPHAAAMSR